MQFGGRQSRRIRGLLWVVVGSVLLSVTLGGYWFIQMVEQFGVQARQDTAMLLAVEDAITDTSMQLADQTQDWKDSLLRVNDALQYDKHLKAFYQHAAGVQRELQRAGKALLDAGMDTARIKSLSQEHNDLMQKYEAALVRLDPKKPLSFRLVDQQVRGADRQLRDDLRHLIDNLQADIADKVVTLGRADKGEVQNSRLYLIGLLGAFLPLLTLGAFWLMYRSLRELARSDATVRSIYNSIGDAVVFTDAAGGVESLNQTAQHLMGWSQQDAYGKPLSEIFQIYDANNQLRVLSPVEIVLRDGCPIPMSNGMLLRRPDATEIAIEDSAAPVYDDDGKMLGVVMVFHNVTRRYEMLRKLQRERALFRQTFDLAAVGMAHLAINGKWLRVNRKLCEITGYSEAELLELSFQGVTHPDDLGRDLDQLKELVAGRLASYHTEKRYIRKNGEIIWVALAVSVVWKEDGSPDYGISIIQDIQARKDAERATETAREQYKSLFEQLPEGVLLIDENVQVIAHNQEAMRQLEYSSEELLKLHVWDFEASDDPAAIAQRKQKILENGRDKFDSLYRTRNGRVMEVDVSIQLVHMPDGRPLFQTLFHDITEQKLAAKQIEHLAYHDQLTGLANRRLLQDRLNQAISSVLRRDANIAVLYLDLDNFKDVNDTLGHQAGDILLQAVTQRLLKSIRSEDTLARVGGDEFVIMLNDIAGSEDAATIAEKIVREMAQPLQLGLDEMRITPSIGISMCPQDARDAEDLLKYADAALYQAKQSGRATYRFYTQALHEKAVERLQIDRLLHKAIEKREFVLHYQPQVDLRDGNIIGCEALIRWNHPGLGQVSPARFIPIAEHSNLILEIGEWVIREACMQAKKWQDQSFNLKVSFNVSARQFMRPEELMRALRSAINDSGVNPAMLVIELTENLLLDPQGMGEVLNEIRMLGVQLALDDFGTGYSSLSYLRRFPINVLKIDQSFVSDADRDTDDEEMVRTIIDMAHNMRMTLVAEGVETLAQCDLLTMHGCEVGQGYHFSHPLPVAEFDAFFNERNAACVLAK